TIIQAMKDICTERGYTNSKFCTRCVTAEFYSTTGASACQCTHLTFDAATCSYETNDNAKAQVRSAIDWADTVCADFTPPMAIPPTLDASAATDAPQADTGAGD
ncbi:MAG TPA: hypothetical protein VGY54_18235, partial [Polyangiaceae bacterium]|nr:hypothetical protein [Polyangiaceae bacterium]